MKTLHNININIPDEIKYYAIGWNANGHTFTYPLRYNKGTKKLEYYYISKWVPINPEEHSFSTRLAAGRLKGIQAFKKEMLSII